MTPGLRESKWAQQSRRRTPAQQLTEDKDKCYRLLRRLYWKADALICSWNRAVDAIKRRSSEAPSQPHSAIIDYASLGDGTMVQSMFKLDFFEFYVLLERYIVLCFDVLGIRVSRKDINGKPSYHSGPPPAFGSHQFHANLLATLDEPDCPLHAALGQQDVRVYLGRAKEYRNRWKAADELGGGPDDGTEGEAWTSTLEALNLATMLKTILGGLEQAGVVVKESVGVKHRQSDGHIGSRLSNGENTRLYTHTWEAGRNNGSPHVVDDEAMEWDDAPWEAVDDAMDLD